jgi:hypothetical protein
MSIPLDIFSAQRSLQGVQFVNTPTWSNIHALSSLLLPTSRLLHPSRLSSSTSQGANKLFWNEQRATTTSPRPASLFVQEGEETCVP